MFVGRNVRYLTEIKYDENRKDHWIYSLRKSVKIKTIEEEVRETRSSDCGLLLLFLTCLEAKE